MTAIPAAVKAALDIAVAGLCLIGVLIVGTGFGVAMLCNFFLATLVQLIFAAVTIVVGVSATLLDRAIERMWR